MSSEGESGTRFLNVDLDLYADHGLDDLIRGFGPSVILLNRTANFASLELGHDHGSLEEAALHFLRIIEALPAQLQDSWTQCSARRFNIGIQAGERPHETLFAMSNDVVSRLGSAGIDIVITVYGASAA